MKKYLKTLIITSIVTILPIIAGLLLWNKLPNEIPTHFDGNGVPNDYSSKLFAVVGLPLFLLGIHLVCFFGTMADPRKKAHDKKVFTLVLWICPLVSLLCALAMYGTALGYDMNVGFIMTLFLGIIFTVIGNYLPKCRRNYTIGIKLPWTMNSDDNWNKTHRLAGALWVIGGIAIIFTSFLSNIWILLPIVFVITIIPTVYSYVYYVKNEKSR